MAVCVTVCVMRSQIADMTGMEFSNASLLDEATAAAEALFMTFQMHKRKRNRFFIADTCHPQSIALMQTRGEALGIDLVIGNPNDVDFSGDDFCGAIVQYPDTYGAVTDYGTCSYGALAATARAPSHPLLLLGCQPTSQARRRPMALAWWWQRICWH